MARGKGYGPINSDVVMVTTRHRGDFGEEFEPLGAARRVSRITSTTAEDLDNIKSRSRRTDQALLSDISNKLAQADFTEPVRVRRGSVAGLRRIVVVPTSSPTIRQRQSSPPPARVVTVNAERGRRATSVPPIPTQTLVRDDDLVFPTYRPPPRKPIIRTPAPPVSLTSSAYAPPPYRPPQRKRAGSEPPTQGDMAMRNARRSLQRLEAELGVYDAEPFTPVVVPSRRHVYRAASVPRSVSRSVVVTPTVVAPRRRAVPSPNLGYSRRASICVPPSPGRVVYGEPRYGSPATARRLLFIDVDDTPYKSSRHVEIPDSYSSLRHKTVEARNKLSQAQALYDRYLPVPTGVPEDVQAEVDYKYGQLAARIPVLERRPRSAYVESRANVSPYKPALSQQRAGQSEYMRADLRHPPPRPKVSEARRHAREVLCRTKRDPNYYNY